MGFAEKLEVWYSDFGRNLPWRGIDNPYYIWLSEIILQQTRIEQGRDYYHRFIEAFPTIEMLASASEEQVLRLWQGLGYYSRARNLHKAAKYVVAECGGRFPNTYEGLLALKGVGRYTAAAVASFAYRLPYPVIDGNVYRFISRLYGIATPIATDAAYSEFETLLKRKMGGCSPDVFNAALMDFGALQCKVMPECEKCPFIGDCVAWREGKVAQLPVRKEKRKPVDRWFLYMDTRCGHRLLMSRRMGKDIWKGLWELPLIEAPCGFTSQEAERMATDYMEKELGVANVAFNYVSHCVHKLTHRTIHASFVKAELATLPKRMPENIDAVALNDIKSLPVSRLIDKYLRGL